MPEANDPVATLADANVLIALVVEDHVHHGQAVEWAMDRVAGFATCPITQGALVRFLVREGSSAVEASDLLSELVADRRHHFWEDRLGYQNVDLRAVVGHRQVTDAYLAALARANQGRLATFDRGLAALHQDVVDLVAS